MGHHDRYFTRRAPGSQLGRKLRYVPLVSTFPARSIQGEKPEVLACEKKLRFRGIILHQHIEPLMESNINVHCYFNLEIKHCYLNARGQC